MNYNSIRYFYYFGIATLVAYALPKISFIQDYFYPVMNYELLAGMPVISIIAIVVGLAAFVAFKYRKIG